MNKVQIMIVGSTTEDAARIADRIHPDHNWSITAATDTEDAISLFQQYDFDIVLLSDTLADTEAQKLSRLFRFQSEDVTLAIITGQDPQTSLEEAFRKRKRIHHPVYSFNDDALKDAMFNIHLS